MRKSTILAESQITNSGHNTITIELVEPEGMLATRSGSDGHYTPPRVTRNASLT
jgi:hypothetical protein